MLIVGTKIKGRYGVLGMSEWKLMVGVCIAVHSSFVKNLEAVKC